MQRRNPRWLPAAVHPSSSAHGWKPRVISHFFSWSFYLSELVKRQTSFIFIFIFLDVSFSYVGVWIPLPFSSEFLHRVYGRNCDILKVAPCHLAPPLSEAPQLEARLCAWALPVFHQSRLGGDKLQGFVQSSSCVTVTARRSGGADGVAVCW